MPTSVSEKDLCAKFGASRTGSLTRCVTDFVDTVSFLYNMAQSTCPASSRIGFFGKLIHEYDADHTQMCDFALNWYQLSVFLCSNALFGRSRFLCFD